MEFLNIMDTFNVILKARNGGDPFNQPPSDISSRYGALDSKTA